MIGEKNMERIAIVNGIRTPFCKMGTSYNYLSAQELGRIVTRELLERTEIDPKLIETFEQVNELVKSFYSLFYKFDTILFNETCNKKKLIEKELRGVKTHNTSEFTLINHSLGLVQRAADFATPLYALSHNSLNSVV